MQQINQLIQQDLIILNKIIEEDLKSNIALINQISSYIIQGGGKRIRPIVTILCGKVTGVDCGQSLHRLAAIIEYIHTATLLHDDVVDSSQLRRGRQTTNSLFGNASSVLVGDFIYSRAFQMMTKLNSIPILKIIADATNLIAEGEVMQLLNIGNTAIDESQYYSVIKAKTAVLFETGAQVAAILTKSNEDTTKRLCTYATNIGIAFQIVDDILDYTSNATELGKNIGDDLREGKITLPLIYTIEHSDKTQQEIIKQHLANLNDPQAIENLVSLVKNSPAISYCQAQVTKFTNLAIASLDEFTQSTYKEAMIKLATLASTRIN